MTKILGLDLGSNSIGWALLSKNDDNEFNGIIDAGVRCFKSSVEQDERNGAQTSNAATRTQKRGLRRQLMRNRRRLSKVRLFLQRNGMLPTAETPEDFNLALATLDKDIIKRLTALNPADLPSVDNLHHILPYYLRKRGLDKQLLPMEFGRAIYHLAQRRGFLLNRKADNKRDDERGVLKQAISSLKKQMQKTNSRTLGEYFCSLDVANHQERIRANYAERAMYKDEFEQICRKQNIDDEFYKYLNDAIFRQRPLKAVDKLVGECSFEPGRKRCSWSYLEAQEYRYVNEVNNLVLVDLNTSNSRKLTQDERNILYIAFEGMSGKLDKKGTISYSGIRKLLGIKGNNYKFSIEIDKGSNVKGNYLNFRLSNLLGPLWTSGTLEFRNRILTLLRDCKTDESLRHKLDKIGCFTSTQVEKLIDFSLPDGYCAASKVAIIKMLPLLKQGMSPTKIYPESAQVVCNKVDLLSPVDIANLRNPVVLRILSELRKQVNSIIQRHGKPDLIRIELARDVKSNQEQRKNHIDQRNSQEKKRSDVKEKIKKELDIEFPNRELVDKVLLAEECSWKCPYTDKAICWKNLNEFEIEHIIPFSRCLDNSFANKTLCHNIENGNVKGNRTPFEAYSGDNEKYERILMNVSNFIGDEKMKMAKLRRFQLDNVDSLDDFCSRQLNDTRYATKLAMSYLAQLFGGVVVDGKRVIQSNSGTITAIIRNQLNLNSILSAGQQKNRDDHRHHAVDAVAIALSETKIVQLIAELADKSYKQGDRLMRRFTDAITFPDWENYAQDIDDKIQSINTMHHFRNRLRGELHKDTIYSKIYPDLENPNNEIHHKRVAISSLTIKHLMKIVDPTIRNIIIAHLLDTPKIDKSVSDAELAVMVNGITKEQLKRLSNASNLPNINGVPIKKVRIKENLSTIQVGKDERAVANGENHHMVLVDLIDSDGSVAKTVGYAVTLLDTITRHRLGTPIIQRQYPLIMEKGKNYQQRYRMVLFKGDIIETKESDGTTGLRIIRSIPQSLQISYVNINDARKVKDIKASNEYYSAMPNTIVEKMIGKYIINSFGEVRRNNA